MSSFWRSFVRRVNRLMGFENAVPSGSVTPRPRVLPKIDVTSTTYHQSLVVLEVSSARCGSHADKHLEHPYAFTSSSDGWFIACLCDGSGDWGDGVAASRVAARSAIHTFTSGTANVPDALRRALVSANEAVTGYPRTDDAIGSSCSAAIVAVRDSTMYVGWVGELEVVVLRDGELVHNITPHVLWASEIASGRLAPEQVKDFKYKDIVLRSLGGKYPLDALNDLIEIVGPWSISPGDVVLLSSMRTYAVIPEPEVLTLSKLGDLSDVVRSAFAFALSKEDYVELSVIAIRLTPHAL